MTQQRISLWGLSVCLLTLLLSASPAFAQKMSGDNTSIDEAGNVGVNLNNTLAGERNVSSATDSYQVFRQEANASIISKTTAVTFCGGVASDCHLMGMLIHTALTGTCAITGFPDTDGAAQTYTLPAGSVGYKDFLGAINSAGALTITCSSASDDNLVMVLWRPR